MAEQQQKTKPTEAAPEAAQETGGESATMEVGGKKEAAPVEKPHKLASRRHETNPFARMRHFIDEMDRVFAAPPFGISAPFAAMTPFELIAAGGWVPAIESFEREGRLVLRADLPGLRREDVQVEVIGNDLVISGERLREERETEGGGFYSEREYGCFERRIPLPEGCDPENIDASFDDGVLTVSLAVPSPKAKGRSIEVKSQAESRQAQPERGAKGDVH